MKKTVVIPLFVVLFLSGCIGTKVIPVPVPIDNSATIDKSATDNTQSSVSVMIEDEAIESLKPIVRSVIYVGLACTMNSNFVKFDYNEVNPQEIKVAQDALFQIITKASNSLKDWEAEERQNDLKNIVWSVLLGVQLSNKAWVKNASDVSQLSENLCMTGGSVGHFVSLSYPEHQRKTIRSVISEVEAIVREEESDFIDTVFAELQQSTTVSELEQPSTAIERVKSLRIPGGNETFDSNLNDLQEMENPRGEGTIVFLGDRRYGFMWLVRGDEVFWLNINASQATEAKSYVHAPRFDWETVTGISLPFSENENAIRAEDIVWPQ